MTEDPCSLTTLEYRVEDHIGYVTINRPEVLNAVNTRLLDELIALFDSITRSRDVWCVVLSGAGRAFCVGADQKERPGMSLDEVRERRRIAPRAFSAMRECRCPVIAQIHGFALGSGLELALGCDMIVAAKSTKMALPETALASIPGGGGTQMLVHYVGLAKAKELIFTSARFDADQAMAWGMLNAVVPDEALANTVNALAQRIASMAPTANAQAKKAINATTEIGLKAGFELEAELHERLFSTNDRTEALRAYREKRPPVFLGN